MEQKYQLESESKPSIDSLREQLVEQKSHLENRIKRLDDHQNREKLLDSLGKIQDISESLIPLQESLNIVWKRTQQIEEEIKEVVKNLS
ncbi:hypothetical protein AUJ84_02435 [Candidatus Pacearchaeota archaeon CG1_02_32_132]|nr:MAG: hypothetical protein AUJ84_02435 [Candidatus Pacearchaeota archaeon CG1_02_32_132]